ncbi:sensor histidine kinase [Alicyclobacillus herbarius]|uniref:sensor histidine kinase n=1 Tax=Alicyclobacillus herbarius TaxID=122960 RepID=UPI00138ACBF6|nr:sensor histidine kinase [Alicyclobacillus herbarius]
MERSGCRVDKTIQSRRHTQHGCITYTVSETDRRRLELHYTLQERHRLARDLHDGVSQDLAYASSLTKRLVADYEAGQAIDLEDLKTVSRILDQSLLELRQAIYDLTLHPDEDLVRHIYRYASDFQSRYNIPVSVDVDGTLPMLDAYVNNQILKVIQEALANVRKHAKAQAVNIHLQKVARNPSSDSLGTVSDSTPGHALLVVIKDDGHGFDTDRPVTPGHYGLSTMRERCQLIGATCTVNSEIGRGTTVQVEVPLS